MIIDVKKIEDGVYIINDVVKMFNFDYEEEGVNYSLEYDEEKISEKEAFELCDQFINDAIESYKK